VGAPGALLQVNKFFTHLAGNIVLVDTRPPPWEGVPVTHMPALWGRTPISEGRAPEGRFGG